MKTVLQSIRVVLAITVVTGVVYPLVVTGVAWLGFREAASGSVVSSGGREVGSALLAQKVESPKYFWPRPSAGDFATVASGASNKGPTSAELKKAIEERRGKLGIEAPDELVTSSGSGLDPHLSPAAAKYQAARVAGERGWPVEKVNALVDQLTEGPQLGVLGEARVNVLALNLALDAAK